jgi:Predicted Zn-dependent hydrolases of the beta-lactamase fold
MPDIDDLLMSHDHEDHLDYATATALRSKMGQVVCPLGVGAHSEAWGYGKETVFEGDWYSALEGEEGFAIHILPARHFSGRSLTRNKTLWAGFALVTPERRIFFSGDSGYGKHFAEIGARFGGFDLAMLDCGQYDENCRYCPYDAGIHGADLGRYARPLHCARATSVKFAICVPYVG